jgi:two-component system chemotaxis response regulator CheB
MRPIRALVLDDSVICRVRLKEILQADKDILVVGEGRNGDHILELIEKTSPQVLLVDLEMPGTAGHATIQRVMANRPLPILVVTGLPEGKRKAEIFESIRRGALELAAKPKHGDRQAESRLRAQVRQLSKVPVVRHVAGNILRPSAIAQLKPPGVSAMQRGEQSLVVGVGASAGGPMAMATMLSELAAFPEAAVVVVQHLPVGFTKAFAEFLQTRIEMKVEIVEGEARISPGVLFLAPDDKHLVMTPNWVLCAQNSPAVEGHRPSVDVLFHSLAQAAGCRAAGVIMSGMGCDGVSGLAAMREAGSLTVAQDQASCGVFGMPAAALSRGAAQSAHAPKEIAVVIGNWVHHSRGHQVAR